MPSEFFDARHVSRRPLHRDQPGREGIEAELVSRLVDGVEPGGVRHALVRYLDGSRSPAASLVALLRTTGSVTVVREVVDDVTARADADSRAGDGLVRDRVDALTRLFVENEPGCARLLAALADGDAPEDVVADAAAGASDGRDDERLFERLVRGGD